jgi:hypothetical protein
MYWDSEKVPSKGLEVGAHFIKPNRIEANFPVGDAYL